MSGEKYTQLRLTREREQKLEAMQKIRQLIDTVKGVGKLLETMLAQASPGLKQTFSQETQAAMAWAKQIDLSFAEGLSTDESLDRFQQVQERLARLSSEGRRLQEQLQVAYTQKADQLGRRLSQQLAELEGDFQAHRQLLARWCGQEAVSHWENQLAQAHCQLQAEQYGQLEPHLNTLRNQIQQAAQTAHQRESQHQKRLYVLQALRQVCQSLGFQEIDGPRYEAAEDQSSRILLQVDTFDRGTIQFFLGLDTLHTLSDMAEGHCFEQFDQLSKYLEEQFGVHTEFRYLDGSRPPKLIRKGERDFPSDTTGQLRR
ncbi:MAG: hypothetical protein NZ602_10625 [Thermoguttaceae bacterium]|nr:hypothetical protein [Thermoguttaceae bacterium]MDW8038955.1 hypothetical protein [Thermoguttaceae bacterium]